MDELRVVRREDEALILANEAGEEYRLVVDSSILSDLRNLARGQSTTPAVSPREIQALIRAGKSRQEISDLTGAEDSDIERYEEPVLAERRFILSNAQAVPVRTNASEEADQEFGTVIAERLISLNATNPAWSSWRDEEAGWMIGLNFDSYEVSHRAIWSFDHRKKLLSPITPDATSLSKLGDVGKRLIPKLRAVDNENSRDRFDSGAFEHDQLLESTLEPVSTQEAGEEGDTSPNLSAAAEAAMRAGHPSTGSIPIIDADAEFERRREIDQLAVKTPENQAPDLGQTADLLDALRRRRGEREENATESVAVQPELPLPVPLHSPEARQQRTPDAQESSASVEPQESEASQTNEEGRSDATPKTPMKLPTASRPSEAVAAHQFRAGTTSFSARSEEDPR